MVENGNRLLRELDRVLTRLEAEPLYSRGDFDSIVEHQVVLLETIIRSFAELSYELIIVDKNSYLKLVLLMDRKLGYFNRIIRNLKVEMLLSFDTDAFNLFIKDNYSKEDIDLYDNYFRGQDSIGAY